MGGYSLYVGGKIFTVGIVLLALAVTWKSDISSQYQSAAACKACAVKAGTNPNFGYEWSVCANIPGAAATKPNLLPGGFNPNTSPLPSYLPIAVIFLTKGSIALTWAGYRWCYPADEEQHGRSLQNKRSSRGLEWIFWVNTMFTTLFLVHGNDDFFWVLKDGCWVSVWELSWVHFQWWLRMSVLMWIIVVLVMRLACTCWGNLMTWVAIFGTLGICIGTLAVCTFLSVANLGATGQAAHLVWTIFGLLSLLDGLLYWLGAPEPSPEHEPLRRS